MWKDRNLGIRFGEGNSEIGAIKVMIMEEDESVGRFTDRSHLDETHTSILREKTEADNGARLGEEFTN